MDHLYASVEMFKNSTYFAGLEDVWVDDSQICGFLMDTVSIIDNYCGRTFVTGNYVEEFLGNNNGGYFTNQMPVNEVQEVSYQLILNPAKTLGSYFVLATSTQGSSGVLVPEQYYWTREGQIRSNVAFSSRAFWTIKYNAGYQENEIPREIKVANMMLARIMADSIDVGNLSNPNGAAINSFQFGKYMEKYVAAQVFTGFGQDNLPQTVAGILKRFRVNKCL